MANSVMESLLQCPLSDIVHKPIWLTYSPQHEDIALKETVFKILNEQPEPVPYFGQVLIGGSKTIAIRVDWNYIYSHDQSVQGLLAIIRDISSEVGVQKVGSPSIIEQVQYSRLASIEEVVARIAHELNQPLAAILNFSQGALRYLEEDQVQSKVAGAIEMISKQAERAGNVLTRLRNFIEKGELRKEWLNINDVIEEVIACMRPEIHIAKINVVEVYDSFIPAVLADKVQIEQVLLNVFQNAIEAMQDNPPLTRDLIIKTHKDRVNYLTITIKDNGCGMSEVAIKDIFDAFHSTKKSGMGIGLAIAQSIVLAHNGDIDVVSQEGEGATFHIHLLTH